MEATNTTQALPMAIYNKVRHQSIERTIAKFETAIVKVKGCLEVHNYAKADEMMSEVMDSAFVLCEQIEKISKQDQSIDSERAVLHATNVQRNVARSLHLNENAQNSAGVAWELYQLQGYGAEIDYLNKVVSVPKTKFNNCIAKIALSVRQHGWHTQIGVL